jgi:16S rRNA (guanine966-N2)-methyltransferase
MKTSTVRIIGGKWRGRKIVFPAGSSQLRPTPDSVRETLFNWLAADITGARCLDLYAGSGALGIEAISRGAGHVTFVEADRHNARRLRENLSQLGAQADVHCMDARRFVRQFVGEWDIIFLDPPFRHGMLQEILALLVAHDCLASGGHVYIESEREMASPDLPEGWCELKRKRAGQLVYRLLGEDKPD